MKENKYRGLTVKTKRWVYGYYCQVEDKHFIIPVDGSNGWGHGNNQFISVPDFGDIWFIEVVPESVGQFVCLDKNDKEVFERANNIRADLYPDQLAIMVWCKQDLKWKLFFPLTQHKTYIRLDKQLERAENIELIEEQKNERE